MTQKQCTESKTGWVHQVHTLPNLGAHCAVSQAWPGRVAGGRPYRRAHAPLHAPCAVSQCFPQPCRVCISTQPAAKPLPSCHDTIDCIVTHPQPNCPLVMIQRLYRDTTPQQSAPHLYHDTKQCIATQSTS